MSVRQKWGAAAFMATIVLAVAITVAVVAHLPGARRSAAVVPGSPLTGAHSPSAVAPGSASAIPTPSPAGAATSSPAPVTASRGTASRTNCAPNPHACGYPDATNTGVPAGTVLVAYSGPWTVTTAGTMISGKDIGQQLTIAAPSVVIKNSKLHGSGSYAIYVRSGSVTVEDAEIFGTYSGSAIGFDDWTGLRLNIHSMAYDATKLGSNVRLQDSYLHDFASAPGAHADGGQMQDAAQGNVFITHNTFVMNTRSGTNATSCLIFKPDFGSGPAGTIVVQNNLFSGGSPGDGDRSAWIFIDYTVNGHALANIQFLNNRLVRNSYQFGIMNTNGPPLVDRGNLWDQDGKPLSLIP
jgi:hypothetical protein